MEVNSPDRFKAARRGELPIVQARRQEAKLQFGGKRSVCFRAAAGGKPPLGHCRGVGSYAPQNRSLSVAAEVPESRHRPRRDFVEPKVATSAYVGSYGGFTSTKGRWLRLDGGGAMVPSAMRIQCDQSRGECQKITARMMDAPSTSRP